MKTALITGGARGIGRGIAERLIEEGWNLALCGSKSEADEKVADAVEQIAALGNGRKQPVKVRYFQCDVSSANDRAGMLDAIEKEFGTIHALVNNAGVGARVRADVLDMTEENYEWLMKINLQGPFFLTQAVAKKMIEARLAGEKEMFTIINTSSISSTVASVSRGEYCISKAGISMATKLWAVRLAEYGIPVYEIRPGIIKTDMTAVVTEKYDKLIAEGLVPQNRWGFPDDIGMAAAMLVRGDLRYSTGQVIMVDGGMLIERL
ncbi:MAG: 3-ketoacyl-ACP reductase [Planctomycetaceae bacterium]|nr:3-ketoacyl-ACP reductase [Planctomycetaceae bacterium]MBQ2820069.1 3-ketoacyl-ACP reductase [Thermoguttaceae bacterium]